MLNFLRKQTNKPIKWALGPLTMVDTLSDNYYKSKEKLVEFAKALNEEARELQDAG
jgi:5-methyltetrahydropteroyltriglutamate--homocysteine methyltransferase